MAKARPISGITADQPFYTSAECVFGVRIAELWDWAAHLPHEERVRELHDMRIAAKRLRYALEFYEPCFRQDMAQLLAIFKRLQDLLGEVHDHDIWLEMLRKQAARGRLDQQVVDELANTRRECYRELLVYWRELESAGFRARLAAAVAASGPGE